MPRYELITLFPGTVSEEEVPAQVSGVRDVLKKHGASVVEESTLGRRKLAYPIRKPPLGKQLHGTYHVYRFDTDEVQKLAGLNTELRISQNVLRHLMLSVKIVTAEELERRAQLQERIRTRRTLQQVQAAQEEAVAKAEEAAPEREAKEAKKEEQKIALEELDEKLEEILGKDIVK